MPEVESSGLENTATEMGPELSASLEAKVSAGLDAVFTGQDNEPDEQPAAEIESKVDATQTDEAAVEAATNEEGTESSEAATEEQPAAEIETISPAATVPTLPAAYVRSLKALEWTDEEIAEAAKTPNFIATAERLHRTRNKEIQAWAEIGRKSRDGSMTPNKDAGQQQTPAGGLVPLDAAALKAKYGQDDLIDVIVDPVNKVIAQLSGILPLVQQTQQRAQQAELEMLGKQVGEFFGGKELETYRTFYGDPAKTPTAEQVETRNRVLETADALMAGARQQGRNLTVGEALQYAHDSVSSGFKTEAVRSGIKQQLQTRNRGISLKPSGRSGSSGGKVNTRGSLEKKVAAGLSSVFTS